MVSNGTRKQRAAKNNESAFIRQEDAPIPPPPITSGITGWLYDNIFASMLDFSTWVRQ